MTHRALAPLAAAALLCGTSPSEAGPSSAASSASDSVAVSVGSVSGSLKTSSNSSTRGNNVAEGDYRIVDVAAADAKPGMVRVQLRAMADATVDAGNAGADGEVFLYLPQAIAEQTRLAKGGVVSARLRNYGIEFADGATRQAFFLVLRDDWYRELQTKAVVL